MSSANFDLDAVFATWDESGLSTTQITDLDQTLNIGKFLGFNPLEIIKTIESNPNSVSSKKQDIINMIGIFYQRGTKINSMKSSRTGKQGQQLFEKLCSTYSIVDDANDNTGKRIPPEAITLSRVADSYIWYALDVFQHLMTKGKLTPIDLTSLQVRNVKFPVIIAWKGILQVAGLLSDVEFNSILNCHCFFQFKQSLVIQRGRKKDGNFKPIKTMTPDERKASCEEIRGFATAVVDNVFLKDDHLLKLAAKIDIFEINPDYQVPGAGKTIISKLRINPASKSDIQVFADEFLSMLV